MKYLEHEIKTRFHSCKLYKTGKYSVKNICRIYKISKASLMRWSTKFDGTEESLRSKSHRPNTPHKNAHTAIEIKHINDLLKHTPNIGLSELYGKLKQNYAYTRHPSSLFRFLRKQGIFVKSEYVKKPYVPKKYHTPTVVGEKMQLDVKFVPKNCYTGKDTEKFYQYTIIDEASRQRFIYAFNEHSGYSSVEFLKRAFIYFGYIPKTIQTDNGREFTNGISSDKKHILDNFCENLNIQHKLIRPYTPRHNGKVERSHRNDNKRFYNYLLFYKLDDLNIQMKAYLKRSNNIPSSSLNWLSPNEVRIKLSN